MILKVLNIEILKSFEGKSGSSSSIEKTSTSIAEIIDSSGSSKSETPKKSSSGKMSASSDNLLGQQSEATLGRQLECANDEIRLLRNKIARLEDDLSSVTQVKLTLYIRAFISFIWLQKSIKTFNINLKFISISLMYS